MKVCVETVLVRVEFVISLTTKTTVAATIVVTICLCVQYRTGSLISQTVQFGTQVASGWGPPVMFTEAAGLFSYCTSIPMSASVLC